MLLGYDRQTDACSVQVDISNPWSEKNSERQAELEYKYLGTWMKDNGRSSQVMD